MKKLLIIIFSLFNILVLCQEDLTIYHMGNINQRMEENPAFLPTRRINFGIPGLSSLYIQHYNTIFNPSKLIEKTDTGTQIISFNKFGNSLNNNNLIGASISEEILYFGVKIKKNYFHISAKAKSNTIINIPKELMYIALYGNGSFDKTGNQIDLSNIYASSNNYIELGLLWNRKISNKFSIGITAKYLYGLASAYTKELDAYLQTDETEYNLAFSGKADINTANINNDFQLNAGSGIGLDVGFRYNITNKLEISASAIDIGMIQYNNNTQNYTANNQYTEFNGMDISTLAYNIGSSYVDNYEQLLKSSLIDTLSKNLNIDSNNNSYIHPLITKINIAAKYNLTNGEKYKSNIGILLQSKFYNKQFLPSVSLSYNMNYKKWLNTSISYSYTQKSFKNIGLGFSVNAGPVQFYMTMDNILMLNLQTFTGGSSDIYYPYSSTNNHIHLGFNITLGKLSEDGDIIKASKDKSEKPNYKKSKNKRNGVKCTY